MFLKEGVLDNILQLNGRNFLTHVEKIAHKIALEKLGKIYKNFKFQQKAFQVERSLQEIETDIRQPDRQNANA